MNPTSIVSSQPGDKGAVFPGGEVAPAMPRLSRAEIAVRVAAARADAISRIEAAEANGRALLAADNYPPCSPLYEQNRREVCDLAAGLGRSIAAHYAAGTTVFSFAAAVEERLLLGRVRTSLAALRFQVQTAVTFAEVLGADLFLEGYGCTL